MLRPSGGRAALLPVARAGQNVFTTQSIAAQIERAGRRVAAEAGGFSLHAGLDIQPGERAKLERPCRYASRPREATVRPR